jgi:hypothetical protein
MANRLIRVNVHQKNDNTPFSSDEEPETKSFVVYDATTIPFGKLKGQPHVNLLKPENANYRSWIVNQSKNGKFFYKSTVKYIEKMLNTSNLDISSTDYVYLKGLESLSDEDGKKVEYFENNINSYFVKINQ